MLAEGVPEAVRVGAKAKPLPFHNIPSGPVIHLHTGHSVLVTVSSTFVNESVKYLFVLLPVIAAFEDKAILGSL